jgi:UDP-glucose 6-dehydrogenase
MKAKKKPPVPILGTTLVIGMGEVGGALAAVLERSEPVLRHDLQPIDFRGPIGVMHLCFPFKSPLQFNQTALSYIERFKPGLAIVHSTVLPGTTRAIATASHSVVAYSPVRGKHVHMKQDLLRYAKFIAAPDEATTVKAEDYFHRAGMKTRRMNRVETLELAKLAETSYFGVLIAFAQELNRCADKLGVDYREVTDFFDEIDFLPRVRYQPGFIGGHCVIPNLNLLQQVEPSPLFKAVLDSNRRRADELRIEARISATSEVHDQKLLADR